MHSNLLFQIKLFAQSLGLCRGAQRPLAEISHTESPIRHRPAEILPLNFTAGYVSMISISQMCG